MLMDIYEVELCRRGRWEQQDARFVAAGDVDEAAYKVAREHLHSEGKRRKVRLRRLLPARRERPRDGRAANERDELASLHIQGPYPFRLEG
jgi:hypothetical protein